MGGVARFLNGLALSCISKGYILSGLEGRGLSPAADFGQKLRALAPEATMASGPKGLFTHLFQTAGLKPRPSDDRK